MTLTFAPPADHDYSTLPAFYQPYEGMEPGAALNELRELIEHSIKNQPRSLQKRIGPSEIGNPCDHCLAAKLAGWAEVDRGDVPWLPFVGTAVHAALEEMVERYEANRNAVHTTGRRFLTEQRVLVGTIDGVEIHGNVDLVDLTAGITEDYKIVGATTLRAAKSGPSQVYRVQAHLYAKGLVDAGFDIRHVAICYLPRNDVSLQNSVMWHEPHDRQIAVDALARAERFAVNIRALRSISEDAATSFITGLPRYEGCRDCQRFADAPFNTPAADDLFAGIQVSK